MHSAIVVSDEASLEELNQLLSEENWWVKQIAPGNDGSWLVILTDRDPEARSENLAYENADHEDEFN